MDHYSKVEALRKNEIFSGLFQDQLDTLVPLLNEIELEKGDFLFKEGDAGESFYLIASGELEILKKDISASQDIHLADLGPGDILGEMASLGDFHRATSAAATRPTFLLEVSLEKLSHIPHVKEIDEHIRSKLPNILTMRVKGDNSIVVQAIKKQIALAKSKTSPGKYLALAISLFILGLIAGWILTRYANS